MRSIIIYSFFFKNLQQPKNVHKITKWKQRIELIRAVGINALTVTALDLIDQMIDFCVLEL